MQARNFEFLNAQIHCEFLTKIVLIALNLFALSFLFSLFSFLLRFVANRKRKNALKETFFRSTKKSHRNNV